MKQKILGIASILAIIVALYFALAMAVVLAAAGWFAYARVGSDLASALDQDLPARGQDLSALVASGGSVSSTQGALIENGESFSEVVDTQGRVLDATRPIERSLLAPAELAAAQKAPVFADRLSVPGLDEPLGDLDRLLQLRMRVELRNLQRQLGLMFIHVTHNQEEALSMADRIVVMNDARIQQIADPLTIATKPATEVVARFMGDNNILRGVVKAHEGDRMIIEDEEQHLRVSVRAPDDRLAVGTSAMIAIRAAAVTVEANSSADGVNSAECEIVFVEFLGDLVKLHLLAGGERMLAKVAAEHYPALRGREGERIRISWKEEDVQLLDA